MIRRLIALALLALIGTAQPVEAQRIVGRPVVVTANPPGLRTFVTVAANPALPNFRSAMAAAQAGTAGPLVINIYGDSTVMGSGAGTGTPADLISNNARGGAINQQLGAVFAANGLSKNGADIFGSNFPVSGSYTAAQYAAFNTSVTPGSWSLSSLTSIGGKGWNSQAAGAPFSWTAEGRPFNKLTIGYVEFGAGGTFRVKIDGVTAQTINSFGNSLALRLVDVPVTLNTHTVEIEWVSGSVHFFNLETIDTTNKQSVRIRNLGGGSSTSADLVDNAQVWSNLSMLSALSGASLHIIEGGLINDWFNTGAVSTTTTASNLTTMMNTMQLKGGDVLLLGPTRSSTVASPSQTAAIQQDYVNAMAALANGTTRAFYDLKTGVGDYAQMQSQGRMFDTLHPNAAGYGAEAASVYGILSP